MRMLSYFRALVAVCIPALLATAVSGIWLEGTERHLAIGLFSAILLVATHSLLIVFMIVTGRILKAAMRTRRLDTALLDELNRFFAEKSAYPVALLAAASIVATGVLGYGQRAFELAPAVHMLCGLAALLLNVWALQLEYQALRDNQAILDRTAQALDRLDRAGEQPAPLPDDFRFGPSQRWTIAALSVWGPYLYWSLIVWKGSFDRVPRALLLGTIGISLLCLICAGLTRGGKDRADSDSSTAA